MSTTDPRRNDDGRLDEPATAVAANPGAERTNDDANRDSGPLSAGSDGAIRDSEQRDLERDPGSTRVLPTTEDRSSQSDHRTTTDDRPTVVTPAVPQAQDRTAEVRSEPRLDPRSMLAREKEEFGGMRFLLAFFGWLTATGLAVLLGAIAGGIFAAVGNSNGAGSSTSGLQSLGIAGAIVTAVILFVAYYAGGYVAGRMARFSGAQQGVAVWLWAIIISVLAAIAGAIGSGFGLFSQVGSIAQVPINGQTLTVVGLVGIVTALALSLLGAVLGGTAGMRFHRKVDRAAFGA